MLRAIRSALRPLLVLAVGALAPASPGTRAATPPLTLVHDVTVTLRVRLSLAGAPGGPKEVVETLQGPAGRTLSVSRVLEIPGEPLRVFLALTPEPDEGRGRCLVSLLSQARRSGRTSSVDRVLRLEPDRVTVVDLWSAPTGEGRLVLALTASWVSKPRLVPVTVGAEPVQFRVQQLVKEGGATELLDDRMLVGIVGSPIRTTIERIAARPMSPPAAAPSRANPATGASPAKPSAATGASPATSSPATASRPAASAATEPAPEAPAGPLADLGEGALLLEIHPAAIEDNLLRVSARAVVGGPAPADGDGGGGEPLLREAVAAARSKPGEPFEVRLRLRADGHVLIFRITPYF